MTLALRSPNVVGSLIPVDNAPVDAVLRNDFARYAHGMREVDNARVMKQVDADLILQKYEAVGLMFLFLE